MNGFNFYLPFFEVNFVRRLDGGQIYFMGIASTSVWGVATNEETFWHLSRQQLFYKRITHTDYSLSYRDFSITHTQDMLETQALWFFEAWYKETNMAFFQIQTKLFEKENPIRVKSLIWLIYRNFSVSSSTLKSMRESHYTMH